MNTEKKPADPTKIDSEDRVQGEGDYDAARRYDEKMEKFVEQHKGEIPKMAKDAEKALAGKEGAELKKAEDIGKAKAKH